MKPLVRLRRRTTSSLVAALLVPAALSSAPAAWAEEPLTDLTTITPAEDLLDAPQQGRTAIRQLGDQVAAAAARNDLRPAELRDLLLTDETVWVDSRGLLYYVEPAPDSTHGAGEAPMTAQVAPLDETFSLHSNPASSLTILLDFDGAYVSGTAWNAQPGGVAPANHPAWDPAGDGPTFNDAERLQVQQVWAMVAEDYAPFDVDVTTEDPGDASMVRSSSRDTVYGSRALITPSDNPWVKLCGRDCGGVAYLDVFDRIGTYAQPAWVFPQSLDNDPKSIAEAATHEVGHNLGLDHDGLDSQDYYRGHGIWAPIMGVGYDRPVVQWSRGSYPGANNQQDDLAIVADSLRVRPDEAATSVATPSTLPEVEAVISTSDDVDAYLLGSCSAGTVVDVLPAAFAPNLDVRAVLYDSEGTQRSVGQPRSGFGKNGATGTGLGARVTVPATGNGWVLTVEGVGEGLWARSGYDDYGSLGAYTVSAPGCADEVTPGSVGGPDDVAGTTGTESPSDPEPEVSAPRTMAPPKVWARGAGAIATWKAATVSGSPVTRYLVDLDKGKGRTTQGTALKTVFKKLKPGRYKIRVAARNAVGTSPYSRWVKIRVR